jgi:hypothetical protein
VRAIPGEYRVKVAAGGQTLEQTATVRMDPRVTATQEDMAVWLREARKIESMDCRLDRAAAELAGIERQLQDAEAKATDAAVKSAIASERAELRPVVLGLRGDARDPGHVNLPGRINWLTIQVGNYSGRPTAAQMEWIAKYSEQADALLKRFDEVKRRVQLVK